MMTCTKDTLTRRWKWAVPDVPGPKGFFPSVDVVLNWLSARHAANAQTLELDVCVDGFQDNHLSLTRLHDEEAGAECLGYSVLTALAPVATVTLCESGLLSLFGDVPETIFIRVHDHQTASS